MVWTLMQLVLVLVAPVLQKQPQLFVNNACHVRFAIPKGWNVQTRAVGECEFAVRPDDLRERLANDNDNNVDLYTINIALQEGSLEKALKEAGFEQRKGEWVIDDPSRWEEEPKEVHTSEWKGYKGFQESRCYGDAGFAGLCEVKVAIISDGKWFANLESSPQSFDEFESILAGFHFSLIK